MPQLGSRLVEKRGSRALRLGPTMCMGLAPALRAHGQGEAPEENGSTALPPGCMTRRCWEEPALLP